MKSGPPGPFAAQLKALREAAGYTQEELATIAGLSVHGVSALERGERRRPHGETVRAISAALSLTEAARDELLRSARAPADGAAGELVGVSLPIPLTRLLGRDADIQTVRNWLADPAARLITLVGPGGVGKTRLALELASAIANVGAHAVVLVPLAAIRDPAFVASAIAEALGLPDVTACDLPRYAQVAYHDRATLVVLDNFEQVLEAAPLVADLLMSAPSLRLLVTSRAPLRVRGEREYTVGPLAVDVDWEATDVDLTRAPAVRLFLERVRDVQPDFRLTCANGPTVTAICRRLDALPLALELAAPWLKVLTAEDLLRQLERDVLLPTEGPRDLAERQRTMNATVAWSYQLLSPDTQRAFRRFGALPGLFPIDAAAAVLSGAENAADANDAAVRAAATLLDKSLLLRAEVSVVPTCPLYYMLETVRAYAAIELSAAGERDDALDGLVRYCTREAALAAEGLVGPGQVDWLDRVREDLESYRSALACLIERGRPAEAAAIAWGLKYFWLIRGHAPEGLRWFEQILSLPSLPPAAECKALIGTALMCYTQGQLERVRAANQRALSLARNAGDMALVAEAEVMLGHVEHVAGNLSVARDLIAHSVEGFRALAIPWGTALALNRMAEVILASGDAGQAERLLDEAALVLQNAGPWFLSLGAYVRAVLAVRRGTPDRAIAVVGESLTRIRALHDKFAFVYTLVPLAAAAVLMGDDAWAARIVGARDAMIERTGMTLVDASTHDLREQAERGARTRLGPDRWTQEYAAGHMTSIDALLEDIDAVARKA